MASLLPNLSGSSILSTYHRLLHVDGNTVYNGTGSLQSTLEITASYAETASYAISASHEIIKEISSSHADFADTASYALTASFLLGSIETASYAINAETASYIDPALLAGLGGGSSTDASLVIANRVNIETVGADNTYFFPTQSWVLASNSPGGSTPKYEVQFRNAEDFSTFSSNNSPSDGGSVSLQMGPIFSVGPYTAARSLVLADLFEGDLKGTAETASLALTASYVENANTASLADTASYALSALSASHAINADTASYVLNAVSSSYATTASYALYAVSASHEIIKEVSSSYADTASYVENAQTASLAVTASHALFALTASYAISASYEIRTELSSSHAINADTASIATTASYALTASYILGGIESSSHAVNADTASYIDPSILSGLVGGGINTDTLSVNTKIDGGNTFKLYPTKSYVTALDGVETPAYTFIFSNADSESTLTVDNSYNADQFGEVKIIAGQSNPAGPFEAQSRVEASLFRGDLDGTASLASTASYVENAQTASLAHTASYVIEAVSASLAQTASYVVSAETASYVKTAQTASYVEEAVSSSLAQTSSLAVTASYALTASYVLSSNVDTSGLVTTSTTVGLLSSSTIWSGSNSFTLYPTSSETGDVNYLFKNNSGDTIQLAVGAVLAPWNTKIIADIFEGTASWADNAVNSTTASYALTASYVDNALTASLADTASYALTAQTLLGNIQNADTASVVTGPVELIANKVNTTTASTTFQLTSSYTTNSNASYYFIAHPDATIKRGEVAIRLNENPALPYSSSVIADVFIGTASWADNAVNADTATSASHALKADSVDLVAGPGVTINGLEITASLRSVNGVFPTNGNVAVSLAGTVTGDSASLVLSSSGDVTASIDDALIWIISGDADTTVNGQTYIWASGSQEWLAIASSDTATNDARYLKLDGTNSPALNVTLSDSTLVNATLSGFTGYNANILNGVMTGSFQGNLSGTATTASYALKADSVDLTAGPGIEINGLAISSSLRTVNGITPTNGNVAVSLAATYTGTSASFIAQDTSSLSDGSIWVISGETVNPDSNGESYVWASSSQAWFPLANISISQGDARYLKLDGNNSPLQGNLNMGGFGIDNGTFTGSLLGNATTATTADTASYILNAVSSSYALTASYVLGASETASYALTASYVANAFTASYVENAQTASYVINAITASYVATASVATFANGANTALLAETANTASYVENAQTASYYAGAMNTLGQVVTISGSGGIVFSPEGQIPTQYIFNGVASSSGANPKGQIIFDYPSNTFINGATIYAPNFEGNFIGTASWAVSAETASYLLGGIETASYAHTASYVVNAQSASYATTASYIESASYALTASYAVSSSYAFSSFNAQTANLAGTADTASYVENAQTASLSTTASYALYAETTSGTITNAVSASYAATASYLAGSIESASYSAYAVTASYVENAVSASYALTASYLEGAVDPFPYTGSAQVTGSLIVDGFTGLGGEVFVSNSIVLGDDQTINSFRLIVSGGALAVEKLTAPSTWTQVGSFS